MLPEPHHPPSEFGETFGGVGIACLVSCDLCGPVVNVVPKRCSAMFWATVPEATVDEDRYALLREDDVRPSAEPDDRRDRDSISKSALMQKPPNSQLWIGVARTVCLHVASATWRRSPGLAWRMVAHPVRPAVIELVLVARAQPTVVTSEQTGALSA